MTTANRILLSRQILFVDKHVKIENGVFVDKWRLLPLRQPDEEFLH